MSDPIGGLREGEARASKTERQKAADSIEPSRWRRRRRRQRTGAAPSATSATTKTVFRWWWGVNLLFRGTVSAAQQQSPNTSPWLLRASALQRFLAYDMPLDQVPMIATHNSYNTEEEGVSIEWEVVPNQVYSLTQQLSCLGVRGLELDIHFVEELARYGASEGEATLVCHTHSSYAVEIQAACSRLHWYLCEALGIYDYGDATGCPNTARTLKQTFEEIAAWMDLPENSEELLYIKLETYVGNRVNLLPDCITEVFGTDMLFGPLDFITWKEISGTEQWPSTEYLVSNGKRLVIGSSVREDADTMFKINEYNDINGLFNEDVSTAVEFRTGVPCSSRTRDPSWSRVQGNAATFMIEYTDLTLYEFRPTAEEFFGAEDSISALECGLIPTFDRMDSSLLEATMWSWEEGEPHAYFSSARAAVAHQETGRWTSGSALANEEESDEVHSYACRDDSSGERGEWVVSNGAAGYFGAAEFVCLAQGLVFGCPRTAKENVALRESMTDANVESVWLNLLSSGGESSSTWARESGVAYSLATTYTHATCDGGGYSAAAEYTWNAGEAWTYGDTAFYEKAERIKAEVWELLTKADALEALSESPEDESTNMDEANALTATAMRVEAERIENSAREAGAYPKGW
ncbi:unnamed protein product [Ectocarpus sp. 12 AP-2014]